MSSSRSIRWSSDDARDVLAEWDGYKLRVKAERMGTVWIAYVSGPDLDYKSEHVSKDAAKQRCAKIVRQAQEKIIKPS